jgi:hypothetical protein
MCLYYDEKATKEILERAEKGEKEFVFFKVFGVQRDLTGQKFLYSPFRRRLVWEPRYVSDRPLSNKAPDSVFTLENGITYTVFSYGIHVFTDREHAVQSICPADSLCRVIKLVKCHIDDFVAAGGRGDAIFTKVEIVNFNTECDILKLGCPA